MPRTAPPTTTPFDSEEIAAILRRAAGNTPAPRGGRGPANLPAVRSKTTSPVPVRALRLFWRHRALHGPVTCPLAAYFVAGGMYDHHGGQDLAVWAFAIGAGELAAVYHRVSRRRAERPLLYAQSLWQQAVIGCTGVYLAAAAVINPADTGMEILLGLLAAGPGIAWWARGRLDTMAEAETQSEPEDAIVEPEPTYADLIRDAWAQGLAATGGVLPGSAATDVTDNPYELGGGHRLRAIPNTGKLVRLTAGNILAHRERIHLTLRAVEPGLHPANLTMEALTDGTVDIGILDYNPLVNTILAQPSGPGTFTHPVASTARGQVATIALWQPGFGSPHGAVTGSTGSGKSGVMNLLIGLDGHTRDAQGRPLVASIVCDPQGGVSYAPWAGTVPIAATIPDIHAVLTAVVAEMERRLLAMKRARTALHIPTPEAPLLRVYVDEVHTAITKSAAENLPILPLLNRLANESRKTSISLTVGTLYFGEEVLKSTLLMDAISGLLMILRSSASATALKVNTGLWDDATNPRRIIKYFADGTPAAGMGIFLRDQQPPLDVRYHWADDAMAATARFGPALPDTRRFITRPDDETPQDEFEDEAAPAGEPRGAAPVLVRPQPADGTAWEQINNILAATGCAMTVDQLHRATGLPKSTISMALGRRAEQYDDVRQTEPRGPWILTAHLTAADLEPAGV